MRLWHYDLISVLPAQQLNAQWRELSTLIGAVETFGFPRHALVNKAMKYNIRHFKAYTELVYKERVRRGYKTSSEKYARLMNWEYKGFNEKCDPEELFEGWHNERYLKQCYYNLQEKHDCNAIKDSEWAKLQEFYMRMVIEKRADK